MENIWQFLEHAANVTLYTIYNSIAEHVQCTKKMLHPRPIRSFTFCKCVPIFKVSN